MTKDPRTQKPEAASHMLLFFIIPALGFLGWAGWKLISEVTAPKKAESALIEKANKISEAKNDGGRWQAAYAFAQDLQRKLHSGELNALSGDDKKILFDKLQKLLEEFPQDYRLKKYLLLTLAELKEEKSLNIFLENLDSKDENIAFYSAWGFIEVINAHPALQTDQHLERIKVWLKHEKTSFRKIASTFLVRDKKFHKSIAALLEDSDKEVQWNAAVALASSGSALGKEKLKEMLSIHNIRAIGFRSKKDLVQFVATGIEAAEKLGDADVLASAKELASHAGSDSLEARAISEAIQGFSFKAR